MLLLILVQGMKVCKNSHIMQYSQKSNFTFHTLKYGLFPISLESKLYYCIFCVLCIIIIIIIINDIIIINNNNNNVVIIITIYDKHIMKTM